MQKSDLVEMLSLFDEQERLRLQDFLASPYSNPNFENPEPARLISELFKIFDDRRPAELQRERLYKRIFPEQAVVNNKLEKLFSLTLKIVRMFLREEYLRKKMKNSYDALAEAAFFMDKQEFGPCQKIFNKLGEWQRNTEGWEWGDYLFNLEIEQCLRDFQGRTYKKTGDQNIARELDALNLLEAATRHFLTFQLFSLNQITPILDKEETGSHLNQLAASKSDHFFKKPEYGLYSKAIAILTENAPRALFDEFCQELSSSAGALHAELLNHFEVLIINYCVRNFSDESLQNILFKTLKNRVSEGRSFETGNILAGEYQLIVKVALLQKDLDWLSEFIENNRSRVVGSQDSEYYYQFSMASMYFEQKRFREAHSIIEEVNFEETSYKATSKALEIKILYETEDDLLPARIDAAKIYYYREKKLTEQKRELYCRFTDFMRRLIRPQTAVSLDRIRKLKQELLDYNAEIAEYYWLLEKVEELEQKAARG